MNLKECEDYMKKIKKLGIENGILRISVSEAMTDVKLTNDAFLNAVNGIRIDMTYFNDNIMADASIDGLELTTFVKYADEQKFISERAKGGGKCEVRDYRKAE